MSRVVIVPILKSPAQRQLRSRRFLLFGLEALRLLPRRLGLAEIRGGLGGPGAFRLAGASAAGRAIRAALTGTAARRLTEVDAVGNRFNRREEPEEEWERPTVRTLVPGAGTGQLLSGRLLEIAAADRVGLNSGGGRLGVLFAVGHDRQRRAVERLAGGQILRQERDRLDHAGGRRV